MSDTEDSQVPPDVPDREGHESMPPENPAETIAPLAADEASVVPESTRLIAPIGMRRFDEDGCELLDAMAGRASVFGFGFKPIVNAIQEAASGFLGDASAFSDESRGVDDAELKSLLQQFLDNADIVDSVFLCPTSDMAIEKAIQLARASRDGTVFRTIALLGSDHGRTGMCRTASGRPELHEGFGPMMAGFAHVPPGDLDAVRAVVDDQTACVILSPIQMREAARRVDRDYLVGLRTICDEHDLLLIVDETQISIGSSGYPLACQAVADDVLADMVVLSAGLFAGMPGGIVLGRSRVAPPQVIGVDSYPMQNAVACATLSSMLSQELPFAARLAMQDFAVALAESIGDYEFVRDLHVLGATIGIETDVESSELLRAARSRGVRLEAAGDTAVRIQPPLNMDEDDRDSLLRRISEALESIHRATADLGV